MSLFNTIKTGASGLGASGSAMAVIGDNIANLGTRGFKKGRISFADMVPRTVGSVNGLSQVGLGATTGDVHVLHQQGGFQSSGSALDLAIGGNGFFQVTDGQKNFYTRDGSFRVDNENYVTTLSGLRLMGYPADNGQVSGQPGPLRLDTKPLPPSETTTLTLNAVLDPSADNSATPLAGLAAAADGTAAAPSIAEMTGAADFHTSTTVYDSLGRKHDVTVMFERTTTGWTYHAVVDGSEIDADGDGAVDDPDGGALQVATGSLSFDTDGNLTGITPGTGTAAQWPGADAWTPTFDFGLAPGEAGSLVQNGDAASTAISFSQDGFGTAYMTSLAVDEEGQIVGQYDNGESMVLGQVALATFGADDGLMRAGGNLYEATLQSGEATLGVAGTGGRGAVNGYALESSNVDLEDEFVSMIQSQRAYQANASTIRTSDESLQTLVQLV